MDEPTILPRDDPSEESPSEDNTTDGRDWMSRRFCLKDDPSEESPSEDNPSEESPSEDNPTDGRDWLSRRFCLVVHPKNAPKPFDWLSRSNLSV